MVVMVVVVIKVAIFVMMVVVAVVVVINVAIFVRMVVVIIISCRASV